MLEKIKWTATVLLIVGFTLVSAHIDWGWYIQITGGTLWLTASLQMGDKPLIWTNAAMLTGGILGRIFG